MNPRQDRSWKIVFETRELSGDEVKILADNFQGEGWLLFKPNGMISENEVPDAKANSGVKTPSQRLRAVMYLYWEQRGSKGSFDAFYLTEMEKAIEWWKSKLEPES